MFEGCLQSMAYYLTAKGYTADKDGWRLEPAPGAPIPMRCHGQVTPESKNLSYEVFVTDERHDLLTADVLCTVDGVKAFLAEGVRLRLVPDWPLKTLPHVEPKQVASHDNFQFGYQSLLAAALGKPSEAFGPSHEVFDSDRRSLRVPAPPYHFMSRVSEIDGPQNGLRIGTAATAEYDAPADAWYFAEHNGTTPFGVLMEVALQPCGWLASYADCSLTSETDLLFRNVDGTGTLHRTITARTRTITTRTTLTRLSKSAGMVIVGFELHADADGERVFDLKTVFGYFPQEAFENQVGLPPTDDERAALEAPCEVHEDIPKSMLTMIDRVTGYWPEGGARRLGRLRSEKDVDPDEWFFKAHFFQDPVQPGSLGVEAMIQLLKYFCVRK
ncbi:FabA-like domain-containing protein [Lentzea jiangxiensis]|uniref:FabA-like domain-containing protein n=1 Tax=Lentzea jiangxiensis TaxID=641025 RepID=A0A1H0X771_9PSEU|nr:FabA-like domain-containing protein [Lentzea jiangxiensis]